MRPALHLTSMYSKTLLRSIAIELFFAYIDAMDHHGEQLGVVRTRARRKLEGKRQTGPGATTEEEPSVGESQDERERLTLYLGGVLVDRAKNASWTLREPLTRICERAIEIEISRLEKENGGKFPQRPGNLPVGRRFS